MEFLIPLKDILIGPGKRFDPSTGSEDDGPTGTFLSYLRKLCL